MAYVYKDPLDEGFREFTLSKKDHNSLFENRQIKWWMKYEYYLKDNTIRMYQLPTKLVCILGTLLYPVAVVYYGFSNYKDVWKESVTEMWNAKKCGSFSSDEIYRREGNAESCQFFESVLEKAKFKE